MAVWRDPLAAQSHVFRLLSPVLNVISGFETVTECLVFKDNWTALISASKEGHLHVVEELLKCGGSLEHRDMVRRCSRPWRDCDGDRPRGAGAR